VGGCIQVDLFEHILPLWDRVEGIEFGLSEAAEVEVLFVERLLDHYQGLAERDREIQTISEVREVHDLGPHALGLVGKEIRDIAVELAQLLEDEFVVSDQCYQFVFAEEGLLDHGKHVTAEDVVLQLSETLVTHLGNLLAYELDQLLIECCKIGVKLLVLEYPKLYGTAFSN
jgi:hypothetical protein